MYKVKITCMGSIAASTYARNIIFFFFSSTSRVLRYDYSRLHCTQPLVLMVLFWDFLTTSHHQDDRDCCINSGYSRNRVPSHVQVVVCVRAIKKKTNLIYAESTKINISTLERRGDPILIVFCFRRKRICSLSVCLSVGRSSEADSSRRRRARHAVNY